MDNNGDEEEMIPDINIDPNEEIKQFENNNGNGDDRKSSDNKPNENSLNKKDDTSIIEPKEAFIQEIPLQGSIEVEITSLSNKILLNSDSIEKHKSNWIDKQNKDNKIYEDDVQNQLLIKNNNDDSNENISKIEGYIPNIEVSAKESEPNTVLNEKNNKNSLIEHEKNEVNKKVDEENLQIEKKIDIKEENNKVDLNKETKPKGKKSIKETTRKERDRYNNLAKKKTINYEKYMGECFKPKEKEKDKLNTTDKLKQRNSSVTKSNDITKEALKTIKKNNLINKYRKESKHEKKNKTSTLSDKDGNSNIYTRKKDKSYSSSKKRMNRTGSMNNKMHKSKLSNYFKEESEQEPHNQETKKANHHFLKKGITQTKLKSSLDKKIRKQNKSMSHNNTIPDNLINKYNDDYKDCLSKKNRYSRRNNSVECSQSHHQSILSKDNSIIITNEKDGLAKSLTVKASKCKNVASMLLNKSITLNSISKIKDNTNKVIDLNRTPISKIINSTQKIEDAKNMSSLSPKSKCTSANPPNVKGSLEVEDSIELINTKNLNDRIEQYQKNNESLLIKNTQLKERNDKMKLDYDHNIELIKMELIEANKRYEYGDTHNQELFDKLSQCEIEIKYSVNQIEMIKRENEILKAQLKLITNQDASNHQLDEKNNLIEQLHELNKVKDKYYVNSLKDELVISIELLNKDEVYDVKNKEIIEVQKQLLCKDELIEKINQFESVSALTKNIQLDNDELKDQNNKLTKEISMCNERTKNLNDSVKIYHEEKEQMQKEISVYLLEITKVNNHIKEKEQNEKSLLENISLLQNESQLTQSKLKLEINQLKEQINQLTKTNRNESDKQTCDNDKEIDEIIIRADKVPILEKSIKDLELKQKKLTITIESLIKALDAETKKNKVLKAKIEEMNNNNLVNTNNKITKDNNGRSSIYHQIQVPINNCSLLALANESSITRSTILKGIINSLQKEKRSLKAIIMKEKVINLFKDSSSVINDYISTKHKPIEQQGEEKKLYFKVHKNVNNIDCAYKILRTSFNLINDLSQDNHLIENSNSNSNTNYNNIRNSYLNNIKEVVQMISCNSASYYFTDFIDINIERQINLIAKDAIESKVGSVKIKQNDDDKKLITIKLFLNEESLNNLNNIFYN